MSAEQPPEGTVVWSWREVQIETTRCCTEEPQEPEIGTHWFDPEIRCLCVWDGAEWELVCQD